MKASTNVVSDKEATYSQPKVVPGFWLQCHWPQAREMSKLYPNESTRSIAMALNLSKKDIINNLFVDAEIIAVGMWGDGVEVFRSGNNGQMLGVRGIGIRADWGGASIREFQRFKEAVLEAWRNTSTPHAIAKHIDGHSYFKRIDMLPVTEKYTILEY